MEPNTKNSNSRVNCCVVGCTSTYSNSSPGTHFYRFPNRKFYEDRKKKWIAGVRRNRADGKPWEPTKNSRICSKHFVGGCKKEHPSHPAYIPTIFPDIYKTKKPSSESTDRFQRHLGRQFVKPDQNKEVKNETKATETPSSWSHISLTDKVTVIFVARNGNDVEIQTDFPILTTCNKDIQTEILSLPIMEDKICGPDKNERYFTGYPSITDEEGLNGLGGVSFTVFSLLLTFINAKDFSKISPENRLLLFLMRLKLGLAYTALSSLFQIHRTTASRIFIEVLQCLSTKLSHFVYWPGKFSIKSTTPEIFKFYPNIRAIIDCTELRSERPPKVNEQVLMYSSYKGTYTVKYLIAVAPNGMITFDSKGYGGRTTDGFITADSGFLNMIESWDQIMADKGFPQIQAQLNSQGVVLIMPPFAHSQDGPFTAQEVEETYKIASERIHVERCISRIRIYKILDKISVDIFPFVDSLMKICCVLVNLQKPIVR